MRFAAFSLKNHGIVSRLSVARRCLPDFPLCFSLTLLLSLTFVGCFKTPQEPVLPTWDVSLTVPLANRVYTVADIVEKDTSLLTVGAGGLIHYSASEPVRPTYIGDLISFSPRDTTLPAKFGGFTVTIPDVVGNIRLPWLPQGATVPIPDTTFSLPDIRDTIETFQRIVFRHGTMELSIRNNLPVVLEVTGPIVLFDEAGGVVASFLFSPASIPPNTERTASADLADRTLTNVLRLSGLSFHTPGSTVPVLIPTGDMVVVRGSVSNFSVRQAVFASIPPQRLTDNDTLHVKLDDSTLVREAVLRRGLLRFDVVSGVNLDVRFRIRIAELERRVGGSYETYEDSITLPALGTGSAYLDFANTRLISQNQGLLRTLKVISNVVIPTGSSQPVTLNDTDRVFVSIHRDSALVADSVTGVVKPTWLNVNTSVKVRFGELPTRFSGQLNILAAQLKIATATSFGFPADLELKIGARRAATGDSVFLQIPPSQRRINPGADSIVFDTSEVGQFLSQFSTRLPDSLRVTGRILVNPGDVYDTSLVTTVGKNSSFGGRASLDIPMYIGITDGVYKDTLAIGDTAGTGYGHFTIDKDRINDLNEGKIFIEVENGIPMEVGASIRLLNAAKQSILLVPQSGNPVMVSAATVDGSGNVTFPANSSSTIQLSEPEVRRFNPAEFLTVDLQLRTPAGSPAVRFRSNDRIRVRAWSTLSYRVKE